MRKNKYLQSGSALITSLLLMSVLIGVTLGVSFLLIREIRVSGDVIRSTQAFYAAEAGAEEALLSLKDNKIFDTMLSDPWYHFSSSSDVAYRYGLLETAQNIPTFDADVMNVSQVSQADQYVSLALNESITLPLFTIDTANKEIPVTQFRVEYYLPYPQIFGPQAKLTKPNVEIFHWKIIGNSVTGEQESISDISAVVLTTTGPDQPTCLGTSQDIDAKQGFYTCHYDVVSTPVTQKPELRNCLWNQVREYYDHDNKGQVVSKYCYPISSFLANHTHNVLVLSNVTDMSFAPDGLSKEDANILYRVKTFGSERLPRLFMKIRADGKSGDFVQSLDILLRRDQIVPAFQFALFGVK